MIRFTDSVRVGETKQTKEGYLVATAQVARTGVQEYLARELGDVATQAGFKPNDVVRVYRHPDQVFNADTLRSVTRVPVTLGHPPEQVDTTNWAKYAVGEVGDAYNTTNDWIVVNPMVKDAAAVQAARTTHREISMGYTANIVQARDGLDADFEMTDMRMNHLALVTRGRAGPEARIGDSWGAAPITDFQPGDTPKTAKGGLMTDQLKTVVLGDVAVQVAVTDVAAIEKFKAETMQRMADAAKAHNDAIAAKDEEIGKLRVDLKAAQDAAVIDVDALVAARSELVAAVKALDAKINVAGKTDAALRREAVAAKLGDAAIANASDAEVTGMFKALAATAKPVNPVADALRQGVTPVGDAAQKMNDAYNQSVTDLNAWRTKEA